MLGNEPDALDATQDALVSAFRALDRFDGRSSFGTWIYRIATNTCIDEMRRRRRRPVTGLGADVAEVADDTAFGAPGLFVVPAPRSPDTADIVAARVDIDTALAALASEFRTAIVLRDVCDLPYDDIAEILAVPVGTVRSRIARARSALAATWPTDVVGNDPGSADVRTVEHDSTPDTGAPQPDGRHQRHVGHRDPGSQSTQEQEHTS